MPVGYRITRPHRRADADANRCSPDAFIPQLANGLAAILKNVAERHHRFFILFPLGQSRRRRGERSHEALLLMGELMTTSKQIFVNAIQIAELDRGGIIPSVVTYTPTGIAIGHDAFARSVAAEYLHDNFKLELGAIDSRTKERATVSTGTGELKSAVGLAKDFVDATVHNLRRWFRDQGLDGASRILVAEPIAMGEDDGVEGSWLTNYRYHVRRILERHFQHVEFLPEPFAVFQYYRYGVKHNLIASEAKHVALVCDFGGGTFDVSVVETTARGDISLSGTNSRPLAASSVPVGGAYLDRHLARALIGKNLTKTADSRRVQQAAKLYEEWTTGKSERPLNVADDLRQFVKHYKRLLHQVETAKIQLCSKVRDWSLGAEYPFALATHVEVPVNPLRADCGFIDARVDPHLLRNVFEQTWRDKLAPAIHAAIKRAREALQGRPIGLILLSGGSANIGWLRELLRRDVVEAHLPDAEVLELQENFQEIVAKGLAVECARRSYSDGAGDFAAVTYNPIHLYLSSDKRELESPAYRPVTADVAASETGILFASSSVLKRHIESPIRWRFRLTHPPRNQLDYHFTRCTWNGEEAASLYNIDHRVVTPKGIQFGASIWVELTVREDATVLPRFVYQSGTRETEEKSVDARPFALDMTLSAASGTAEAYVGFDFGSSNSAYSFVKRSAISTFAARAREKEWVDLNALIHELPYPVANAFKRFIAESKVDQLPRRGLAAVEAALGYAAYLSYSEASSIEDRRTTAIFKNFAHRSAGPLWRLLRDSQVKLGKRAVFTGQLQALINDSDCYRLIDHAVDNIAAFKHEKEGHIDYRHVLTVLGNALRRVGSTCLFGSFENVRRKSFSSMFEGDFRVAMGADLPFVTVVGYQGHESFSDEAVYAVNMTDGSALPLLPLMFWSAAKSAKGLESPDLFLFDRPEGKSPEQGYSYKAVASQDVLIARDGDELGPLVQALSAMRAQDQRVPLLRELQFAKTVGHD